MKKIVFAVFALAAALPAAAQDTYESARLVGSDLNGTARYVGMGGAMDALGADISTISSNPAGIGLFRHSTASVSLGFVSQKDAHKFDGKSTTTMSFDQAGFVYSNRLSRTSFVNFSFNYHKSRNFNMILSAANALKGCSQNGLTYDKAYRRIYDFDTNKQDEAMGYSGPNEVSWAYSQADYLNANYINCDVETHINDPYRYDYDKQADWVYYYDADQYSFDRAQRGWINNFDINISGNVNDRFFWGFTVGIKDVNYRGYSEYAERLIDAGDELIGGVATGDDRKIKGTGLDVTAGIIFRPIETSPFRIGLSIATPTWYDLTASNNTLITDDAGESYWDCSNDYDFKLFTPWKFGLSLGHTIGTQLALGAGYEYSDYSTTTNRVNKDDRSYWYSDYGYTPSYTDEAMKQNTERSLRGVHTLKAGVEYKPIPEFAVRVGYNYQTSPYEENGVRDMYIDSPGVAYASTTDYVNWKDTHRFTCGLGVKLDHMNIDLAYQYSGTDGDFHPFQPYEGNSGVTKVSNKRHQVLLTLGYTF